MSSRATLTPAVRPRFASGSLALDFIHGGVGGAWQAAELLQTREDLQAWISFVLDRDVIAREKDLEPARALREAIWRISRRHLAHRSYRPRDVEVVNGIAAGPLPVARLEVTGEWVAEPVSARQAFSAIATDAVRCFSEPQRVRVRECAAPDCHLLFFDASRPGRRQWCSMARCGNVTKTRAYRSRAAEPS